jgi:hypothetical protein
MMSYSRNSFYLFKKLCENGGDEALQEISRKKPNPKNRVPDYIEEVIIKLAIDNPALGRARIDNELVHEGILIFAGGVRSVWIRSVEELKIDLEISCGNIMS